MTTTHPDTPLHSWNTIALDLHKLSPSHLFHGDVELLRTRPSRQQQAESLIRLIADIEDLHPSSTAAINPRAWASDGSMVPAASGIFDPKSVTLAITGPRTAVFKIHGRNCSILHSEIMGLIAAHTLIDPGDAHTIYSHHQNSVCLLADNNSHVDISTKIASLNG